MQKALLIAHSQYFSAIASSESMSSQNYTLSLGIIFKDS